MSTTRVAIIGAGVAGLTAAYRLRAQRPVVLEASGRLGGQVHTEWCDGFVVERGAEGFVARSEAIPELALELGLAKDEVIDQLTLRSYGYDGSELIALRPGEAASFLGFQVAQQDLGRGIRSLRRGMGSLVLALRDALAEHAELRLNTRASSIEPRGGALAIGLGDGQELLADAVIIAIPCAPAAPLLARVAAEPALALSGSTAHSSTTVELAYPRHAIAHPLDGTGFVIASAHQRHGLRACTFSGSKFAARTPSDAAALRLFFRPDEESRGRGDDDWIELAQRALAEILDVREIPHHAWVSRWPDALPVFDPAHRARIAALQSALAPHRIVLAGSAFCGSGLDAAVASGNRAAECVLGR